ncbi:type IV toxin-antitoxin system AbiEi family antitoxin domain-containing protein [Demequina capsici]|uniref:Type IV toxin-antitoxin system AbiEi family antitoxin domain-containing protein n=1 Tax=Demequina capsici TaxID=3075620 RepID=A0AA96JB00_9MICO|nr:MULTISPECIES: type IV toxin-antitoxin system AbiEi family antitoxin domain-containing protein [unclassified Demequina]WNM25962.1 type IV toxin-antitoxin system AbiEi family antitoxin domain-containing protein [Demequina sp. OYTSA14]WNM28842.1 type IV toxin-antitoxin system AbiEi family antitoxin domain-containing protein [Demequina sp. PMTSA13]
MVTSAQASVRGVSHMNLNRLTESGDLVRLAHGVYKDAGAPGGQHDELRAAWLASDPARLAWERLRDEPSKVVVSGESAAVLHDIGDFRAVRSEFTTPHRKQTQRPDVHYRTRTLTRDDITVREGLPVTTAERTIADLVEQRAQLDHVGDALRDATRKTKFDSARLVELLGPLAERNGHAKGDGNALLEELLEVAHIDLKSLSRQIVDMPDLGALVARDYLAANDVSALLDSPALQSALEAQTKQITALTTTLSETVLSAFPSIDQLAQAIASATATFDSAALRAALDTQAKQVAAMSQTLERLVTSQAAALPNIQQAIANLSAAGIAARATSAQKRVSEAIVAADWAMLAQVAQHHAGVDIDTVEAKP